MKLSSLRYFVTIAKYKSYTKASEHLFISQPTLSRTVMELEQELGIRLFVREKNNLHMTKEGELLFREAVEILEKCDSLPLLFHEGDPEKEENAVIRIGYQQSMNIQWAWPVFHSFMKENPKCRIVMDQCPGKMLTGRLLEGHYDMAIAFEEKLCRIPEIDYIRMTHSRLQLVVDEHSDFAEKDAVGMMELEKENFIMIDRKVAPEVLDRVIARCIMNGFSPNASDYVGDLREALEHVSMGDGISFIHSCMRTEGLEKQYHVRILDLKDEIYDADVVLGWISGKETSYIRKLAEAFSRQ